LSDTFAGIAPAGIIPFIAAQFVGMFAAVALSRWLWRDASPDRGISSLAADRRPGPSSK
jgi:hypothetical protein